jgi:hypothetical protein
MKIHNHYWILFAVILVIALIPSAYARSTEKIGVYVDYNSKDKIATISNIFGEVMKSQQIENTPQCINCHSLTKLTFAKDINYIEDNWKTDFNIVDGSMSDYRETIYYLENETYSVDVNDYGTCKYTDKINKTKPVDYEYRCITGSHKEERTRIIEVIPDLKEGWKKGIDYYVYREATLKVGSLIDYIPVTHGVSIDEEAWWDASYPYKRLDSINQSTASSFTNFSYLINGTRGFNIGGGQVIAWTSIEVLPPTNLNGTQYLYYKADGTIAEVNYSENLQRPLDCEPTANTCTSYTPTNVWSNFTFTGHNVTKDSTINNLLVTLSPIGSATQVENSGYIGNAINMSSSDASNDNNLTIHSLPAMNTFTLCFWFRTPTPSTGMSFFDDTLTLLLLDAAAPRFEHISGSTDASCNYTITANQWEWICYQQARLGVQKIYLNGTLCSDTTTNTNTAFGGDITTNLRSSQANQPVFGDMDELEIYHGLMSSDEIKARYAMMKNNYSSLGAEVTPPNTAPFIQNITITPSPAYTDSTLNCSANYGDAESDKGNVSVYWYNGSTLYSSNTILNVIAGQMISNNTQTDIQAKGETWNCTINATDSQGLAGTPNSTTIIISGSIVVNAYSPLNNTNISSNTPNFIFNYTHVSGLVGTCQLNVNGTNRGTSAATSGINTTIISTPLTDGLNQNWTINCSNGTESANSSIYLISIDTTKPILSILSPNGEYFTYGIPYLSLPLNYSYIENNKDTCSYNIDGDFLGTDIYSYSGTVSNPEMSRDSNLGTFSLFNTIGDTIYLNFSLPNYPSKAQIVTYISGCHSGICTEIGHAGLSCYDVSTESWIMINGDIQNGSSYVLPSNCLKDNNVNISVNNSLYVGIGGNIWYYETAFLLNNTITSCSNQTINITNSGNHILNLYMNDTFGNENSSSSNFSINLLNTSSYTLKGNVTEGEIINFFLRVNSTNITSINATFYLNNTAYIFTNLTNTSITALFTKALTIPSLPNGNYPFYWNYSLNSMNNITDTKNITINQMIFGLCNDTLNSTYLSISFKDETLLTVLNGTIPLSSWTYGLASNPSYTKSYSFVNASENLNYSFCFMPIFETTLVTATIQYGGTGYPSKIKTITNQSFTNITTNMILYLLSTSEGLYSRYTTISSSSGINIIGTTVTVQRVIDGILTTINFGVTDSSGTVTFWLNPDFEYTFTFVKSGYGTRVLTLRPTSSEVYYISMTPTGTATPSINVTQGLNYSITPTELFLNNNTFYNFSFCGYSESIDNLSMNLTNGTNQQVIYILLTGQGCVSSLINTDNYTSIQGRFRISQGSEIFETLKAWTIQSFYKGIYSLMAWIGHFNDYNFGSGGQTLKVLIMLIVIFGLGIGLSYLDVIDSSVAPMIGITIGVAIFSYIGWLSMPISGDWFTNQYSVLIVMFLLDLGFIIWRVNTQ